MIITCGSKGFIIITCESTGFMVRPFLASWGFPATLQVGICCLLGGDDISVSSADIADNCFTDDTTLALDTLFQIEQASVLKQ